MHIVLGCLAFLALFVLTRQLQPQGILFYQGVACAVAGAVLQGLLALRGGKVARGQAAKDALITLLAAYAFMFTVPTTVDRAYSVRMLQLLAAQPQGLSQTELEDWFKHRFIAQGGVARRVREQLATGSLQQADGRYVLTERGHWLSRLFGFFQWLFRCGDSA